MRAASDGLKMGKYTELFISEARKNLDAIAGALETLAAGTQGAPDLGEIARMAHSIKGMALFEGQESIAELALAVERACTGGALRPGAAAPEPFRRGVALLRVMVDEVAAAGVTASDPSPVVEELKGGPEQE